MKIATENYVKLKNSLKIFKIAQIIQENDEIFLNCHKLVDPVYNDQLIAYSFSGISIELDKIYVENIANCIGEIFYYNNLPYIYFKFLVN